MLLHIINYFFRGLFIVLGIVFLTRWIHLPDSGDGFIDIMGVVFILFGIYRIVIYRMQSKRYSFRLKEDDDE